MWMSTNSLLTAAYRFQLCSPVARWNSGISMPTDNSLTVAWLTASSLPAESVLMLSVADQGRLGCLDYLVVLVRPYVLRLGEEHQAEAAFPLGVPGQAAYRRDDVAGPHASPVLDLRTPVELELQPGALDAEGHLGQVGIVAGRGLPGSFGGHPGKRGELFRSHDPAVAGLRGIVRVPEHPGRVLRVVDRYRPPPDI